MTTSLSGLGGVSQTGIVGTTKPEWDVPGHGISDRLRGFLMRVDAGESGLNAAEDMPPDVIDEMRRMINAGVLKPKNQAAMDYARAQGGLQAGDRTLLGPLIDGMPEGLTPEYWAVVIQKAQQAAQEQIQIMDRTGYFEGKSTLERQRIEADISNNIARTEIDRRLADNTIRQTDMDEAYRRDQMAQDMRQNVIAQFGYDPGPQGAMGAAVGNEQAGVAGLDGVPPIPGSPQQKAQLQQFQASQGGQNLDAAVQAAQAAGAAPGAAGAPGGADGMADGYRPNMTTQVGSDIGWQWVNGQGWQQTLGGRQQDLAQQQQAFAQQQAQAELASNPRNYLQAQMLGNARGGMAGMAPTNQVAPSTQYPGMAGMAQPGMQQQWPALPGQQPGMPAQPVPDGMALMQAQMPAQPLQAGQPGAQPMGQFQAPGNAGMGATAMQASPMAQPMMAQPGQPGQQPLAVGAFSQALNRNRLVPKSGAMNTQGAMMTMDQIGQQTNPQKWRAQDFMRGNASEKSQALGTASAAGFSDEDTQSMLGKSLPTFKAPGAGAMM